MDMHRPLWEMYIIEGLEELEGIPSGSFAVLFKMHHSTFDGMAAGAAMSAILQDNPTFQPEPPSRNWVPERKPDFLGWTVSSLQEGFSQWLANVKAIPGVGKTVAGMLANRLPQIQKSSKSKVPKTRFQRRVTTHRVWDFIHFEMAEMQALRAALGKPKMNDLLLCLIGGALRRYLQHHDELPDESLQTLVPVNLRGAGNPTEAGNQVSAFVLPLGTDLENPLERIALISEGTIKGKTALEKMGPEFIGSVLSMSPYMIRSRMIRGMAGFSQQFDRELPAFSNTVVTNAPLPRGGHYFAGAKVLTYVGFGPVNDFVGLFHTITGVDFEINISFTSCRSILPDVDFYRQCLADSYAELKACAASKTQSSAPKRALKSSR
jgi:WS/DGAT/MGAT family acyltransferase